VRAVVHGIKTDVKTDVNSSPVADVTSSLTLIPLTGLTSPDVTQESNTDCAVEFEFKRPVKLAGIWLRDQVPIAYRLN